MNVHRSAHATANGYFATAYGVSGFVDQNSCSLSIGEADGVTVVLIPSYGGVQYSQPLVTCDGPSSSQLTGAGRPLAMYPLAMASGPYAITVSNPRHSLQNTGAVAAIVVTMAAPFASPYGYAFGQKTRVYWDIGNTAGSSFTFAHNAAGLRLNADCTLATFGDWIELEFNGITSLWHEAGRSIHAA